MPPTRHSDTTPRHLEGYMTLHSHGAPVPMSPRQRHGLASSITTSGRTAPLMSLHGNHSVGRLTPPASGLVPVSSVSPQTVIVLPQPPQGGAAAGHVSGPTITTNNGALYHPNNVSVPHGDYFSPRNGTQVPPHHYSADKRVLVLLLLESILRMALSGVVAPSDLSPAIALASVAAPPSSYHVSDRLNLFLQESTTRRFTCTGPIAAYQTPVGQIVYAQSFAPYPQQLPPQPTSSSSGGSAVPIAPVTYGFPPLAKTILQPYSVPLPPHYGQVMVGPNPLPPTGSEQPAHLVAEQNYALINKRRIIKRRTRTGCLTCRKRRIKCDERKPHCFNCERLKKLCLGYEVLPTNSKSRDLDTENNNKPSSHRSSVHDLL